MMQAATQAPPPPPPAPPGVAEAPAIPGITSVSTSVLTSRDVAALRARGRELSDQLSSVVSRRRSIIDRLKNTTPEDRVGLEQRLGVLDARIVNLESQIEENGKQLASLPAALAGATEQARGGFNQPGRPVNIEPIAIVFTLFVLCPIALSISRYFWRRGSIPKHAPASPENTQRLERMEQAIDTIAIEIERVSEGQRFVTRLLAESQRNGALVEGQSAGEAVPVAAQDASRRF